MKNKIPETLKFKKIDLDDLFLQAGLVTNRHWIGSVNWLLSLENNRELGLTAFKKKVLKAQVRQVTDRLAGKENHSLKIEEVFYSLKLDEYREVSREEIKFHLGFISERQPQENIQYLSFGKKKSNYFSVEYGAVIFFDKTTKLFLDKKNQISPLIIKDSSGQVVFALSSLNPKNIEEKENE